jgi:hypothetical protein
MSYYEIYWVNFLLKFNSLYFASPILLYSPLPSSVSAFSVFTIPILSQIHYSHYHVHCQHSQHYFLILHSCNLIRYTAPFKSFNYLFWKDPLPWSWFTSTAVPFWASSFSQFWQTIVPCQEPIRIQLFQVILERFIH